MKVSNETKIGALAAVAITVLILGFNFLKGRNLTVRKNRIFAVFSKVDGLNPSDAVRINGLQVGNVYDIVEKDQNLSGVVVSFNITRPIQIPDNSYAVISANPLGSTTVNIVKGLSTTFVKSGDTLATMASAGLFDDIKGSLNPAMEKVNGTLKSLDSLLEVVGTVFDPKTKNNLQAIINNLATSTSSLNGMLDAKNGELAHTLANVSSFTGNLKHNNDTINHILGNVDRMTAKMASLDLETTLKKLQAAVDNLNGVLSKANKGEGTVGLLLNDKKLYNNLTSTSNSLNVLLQDLRLHPKRYINVSVFGKKDKTEPLMSPLPDSAAKAPQP
jgi:phospholipid/cholesterol/gamma-HCH transport system substrate-binding protein